MEDYIVPNDIKDFILKFGFLEENDGFYKMKDKTGKFTYLISIFSKDTYKVSVDDFEFERKTIFTGFIIKSVEDFKFLFSANVYLKRLIESSPLSYLFE